MGTSRGFTVRSVSIFAIRKKDQVHVYLNRCPHLDIALEWAPDDFLDPEGFYIRCCNHGALFEIETGNCIMGPCVGDALWSLDCHIENGNIMLDEAALPEPPSPD